jgi:hypothetical protein
LEQAHHLMVQMDRARQGIVGQFLFQHHHIEAFAAKQVRSQRADRPAANNRNIEHGFMPPLFPEGLVKAPPFMIALKLSLA